MGRVGLVVLAWGCAQGCGRIGFETAGGSDGQGSAIACDRTFTIPGTSEFTDDFSTGVLTDRWNPFDCVAQQSSALVAAPFTDSQFCWATTLQVSHLTCDSATVRVLEAMNPNVVEAQTLMYIIDDVTDDVEYYTVRAGDRYAFATGPDAPADPAADLWWRLREEAGYLVFDTSSDGLAWIERRRHRVTDVRPDFSMDSVRIGIGGGLDNGGNPTGIGRAVFDCYNIPPPCP